MQEDRVDNGIGRSQEGTDDKAPVFPGRGDYPFRPRSTKDGPKEQHVGISNNGFGLWIPTCMLLLQQWLVFYYMYSTCNGILLLIYTRNYNSYMNMF